MKRKLLLMLLVFEILSLPLFAMDEVKFEKGQGKDDPRMQFKLSVIEEALKHTYDEYGEYKITTNAPKMNGLRAMGEMQKKDGLLNTFIALTNNEWESKTIPIRIPIRRGILNYRILLVNKNKVNDYANIRTEEELKEKVVGLKLGWTATKTMKAMGFNVMELNNYEGLFQSLNADRFDYLPRGINEVFKEFDQRKDKLKNLAIEPNLLLVIPNPTYIFVSPKHPRLAARLEKGLEKMVEDGSLKAIFDKYNASEIKKADIKNRFIINLGNPLLPEGIPFDREELWVDLESY